MANYLDVPTASGASTPDQAGLAATNTSIDLRFELAPVSWASGAFQGLINQYINGGSSGSRFWWGIGPAGIMEFDFFNNIPAGTVAGASVATGFSANSSHGIRVLQNISAGTVDFYTSSDFTVWTSLGTQVTGLNTAPQATAGTAPVVRIGTDADLEPNVGKITRAQVLINGATILNMDWTTAALGNGPWVATSGETWTRMGTASVLAEVSAPRNVAGWVTRSGGY